MKKKNKKIISFIMTFLMCFSILDFSILGLKASAEGNGENETNSNISIRVEGIRDNLFDKEVSIKDEVYVKDLLSNAVGENNIEGLDSNNVTKILGEERTGNIGWMYYLVDNNGDILQGNVISEQLIKDIKGNYYKEMVWHMAKWVGGISCIPKIHMENTGNSYKLKITEENVMMGIDPRPAKEVNVKVEGVGEYKTDENGEVSFKVTEGEHKVYIYKNDKDLKGEEYPAIVRQCFSIVGETSESETKLENIIKDIRKYYENNQQDNYLNILSFNHINSGEKKNFKLEESNNVAAIADNIMGIIAIGKNPYSYEGVNYVEKLIKAQSESGKFILGDSDEESVTAQSEAIIALDMASAKYDVDKASASLIGLAKDGKYEDIDSTIKALIALSKHKDVNGVNELIEACLNDLKDQQLEGGGFDYYGMGNSPYSTAPVIQALITVGENPLEDKWTKGGRNLLDALLACKVSDNGFEFIEGMGGGFSDPTATNLAFAAIADIYKGQSMYQNFKFKLEEKSDLNKIIKEELEDIKEYYNNTSNYDFNTIVGLKALGIEDSVLQSKAKLNNKESILFAAGDVISIIGMGKNPRNYNGKNYVDILVDYIKNPKEKYIQTKAYLYSLIALDMASGDKEDIKIVLEKVKSECKSGKFNDIVDTALVITALSNHKNEEGIADIINSAITYLKDEQLENGAFTIGKDICPEGDSQDTAFVIEALITAGEDPLSKEWTKDDKTLLDALLSFKMGKGYIYSSMFGAYEQDMYTSFVLRVFIALRDKETVFNKFKVSYDADKDKTEDIKNTLKDLKTYYSGKENYEFRETLALNHSSNNISEDIKNLQGKYKVRENADSAASVAANIMGIIASGKDPKKYNGVNYVEKLTNSQVKNGEDKGKFIIEEEDGMYPTTQAYAIIALDMADSDYNKEAAIKTLCNMSINGVYSDIDTTAMVITALATHKDIKEAENIVKSSIKYLKEKQNNEGGYDTYGQVNNPCTISTVIQALVANNIDPLSDEWAKENSTMVDALLKNKVNGNFGNDFANNQAFMALADLYKGESMFKSIRLLDASGVKKVINELKDYYSNKDNTYNYIQALTLSKVGFSKDLIMPKLQLREKEPDFLNYDNKTTNHAKNIIAIVSAGLDPRNYEGENYVDILVKSQNDEGQFKLPEDDKSSIISQAYSIIALDMCKENYDIDGAIKILKDVADNIKNPNLSIISSITIALSNHRDIEGVNNSINNCVQKLKELQIEDGGFSLSIKYQDEKCSEYTSEGIQALISAGEDVLSPAWSKNGKTPLDALMTYKKGDHFIYDEVKASYNDFTDQANGMAFAALVSIYNGESVFKALNPQKPDGEKPSEDKEFQIKNLTEVKEFKPGNDAKITVQAINNTEKAKNAALIVGLFDENGKLVNYVGAEQSIENGKSVEISGIIKLPKEGEYTVKAFVWDDLEEMNSLSNVIEKPVK
ncbi:hypothetical protein [uncultured Clostridium sp.]|uniref:hypothetical protein n=1 Tax=uncultured Clostridium sp. TaxID=59620 RepID=UPI0028EDD879|nr:hypothetical protein [uncultured Clostridium sp.]